jgi:predicted CXXCH cytochrome family protein
MKVPPGQPMRVIPIGAAYEPEAGPAYRSLCLRCHAVSQTSFAVGDWRESLHARAGVMCGACHGSHESGFVPQPGPAQCLTCHAQEVEEFLVSGHGPERAPGMRCVSCHEAHATSRGLARSTKVCTGCHLDSDHVQGFAASRMGQVQAQFPPGPDGEIRAPDCVYCHMPLSPIMTTTGDFRNDKVVLHDPAATVARHPRDERRLAESTIERLLPLCVSCHSERNARYRLEHSDPLIRHWTPVGMSAAVRRAPVSAPGGAAKAAGVPGEVRR